MDQGLLTSCTRCGGHDLRNETVRSAFWHEARLIVIEDIPALICTDCQEQFYDDLTAVRLDLLRGAGFPDAQARTALRVPVFSLRDGPETEGY